MIGLIISEVYNSVFYITEENNQFELYKHPSDDEFSYTQWKNNISEILGLSYISPEDLEHETYGPSFIKTYRKLSIEKSQTDGYSIFLLDYIHSPFLDFESYLKNLTGLNEDDIHYYYNNLNQNLSHIKFLQAPTPLKTLLKFFQEVLKRNLKTEEECDQIINMINLIQLSSIVIKFPW